MYDEWQESAHSQANKGVLFRAMRDKTDATTCNRCHAPLAAIVSQGELSATEGVTCEVCHRIGEAKAERRGAGFELRRAHDVKYGPLCGANEAYFHKTECVPVYAKSLFCASCHLWWKPVPGGGEIPVYTEYEDWQKGPYGKTKQCQSCHMPGDTASLAVSEIERKGVPNHGFMGRDDLRDTALTLEANVKGDGELIRVEATVGNARAGHPLPAGMSGHQLVLRALLRDGDEEVARAEAIFERQVVDDAGKPVAFFEATRVGEDTRILPKGKRTTRLELRGSAESKLSVELLRREIAPEVAKALGVRAPEETTILAAHLQLGAAKQKGPRGGLPRHVKAGKP